MSFETEPLKLKPIQWNSFKAGDAEVAAVFTGISDLEQSHGKPPTVADLILHLRGLHPPVRLAAIKRAIETLADHDLLENATVKAWIHLHRHGPPAPSALHHLQGLWRRPNAGVPSTPAEWADLPFLRQLEPSLRSRFLKGARLRHFPAHFRLVRQGGTDRDLMIILEGRAAVVSREPGLPGKTVAILQKGAVFGEVSYFLGEKRSADVIALTDCSVLCLPPQAEFKELEMNRFKTLQLRLWFLQAMQRNPLFEAIPPEAFDALMIHGIPVSFDESQTIVKEGESADACYFIIQGKVGVTQSGKTINRLTSGSIIGEIGLFAPAGIRTATAAAETDVLAIKYDVTEFWNVLSEHFTLGLALEALAEKRLDRDGPSSRSIFGDTSRH